jgi:hypothetical protein
MQDLEYKDALILLEDERQVSDAIRRFDRLEDKRVIALSPFAMYELDKQDIPYKLIEEYCDQKKIYELGMSNYSRVEDLCRVLDIRITSVLGDTKVKPAFFSFYDLKIDYDAITIRLLQLLYLIEKEKPSQVFIYQSKKFPFGICERAPGLLFDSRESLYSEVLNLEGWPTRISFMPLLEEQDEEKHMSRKGSLRMKVIKLLKENPALFSLVRKAVKQGPSDFVKSLKSRYNPRDVSIIIYAGAYNWDDSVDDLIASGLGPIFRECDDLAYWLNHRNRKKESEALHTLWEKISKDNELREYFCFRGMDFFQVIESRLKFLIMHLSIACMNAYQKNAQVMKDKDIKALLSSQFYTCTGLSTSKAARDLRIPVITWQHGGYGISKHPFIEYLDFIGSDVHLVFGEGVAERFQENAAKYKTRLVPVGSSSLEQIIRKNRNPPISSEDGKTVLYVTSNIYRNTNSVSWFPPFSDDFFWLTQKSIIDALGKHKDSKAIIKTHPSSMYRETPMREYAKNRGFENIMFVKNEQPLTSLLQKADVIVIDLPTTTLLQALTTEKPVFIYFGHYNIDEEPLALLEHRAFCFRNLESLTNALEKYLSGDLKSQYDKKDSKFLEMFGIGPHGTDIGKRAASIVLDTINEKAMKKG